MAGNAVYNRTQNLNISSLTYWKIKTLYYTVFRAILGYSTVGLTLETYSFRSNLQRQIVMCYTFPTFYVFLCSLSAGLAFSFYFLPPSRNFCSVTQCRDKTMDTKQIIQTGKSVFYSLSIQLGYLISGLQTNLLYCCCVWPSRIHVIWPNMMVYKVRR